jgi:DNA-binding transcriptional LysR family regulator
VRAGQADLGFIEAPAAPTDLSTARVGTDRVALVVAADDPLAARTAGLRGQDLLDAPLLLREPGSGTRDTFLQALAAALGVREPALPHATELGSTTTIVATVRAGGGVGVVSARAVAAEVAAGRMVELAVAGLSLVRPLRALWQGSQPSGLAGELVTIASTR